MDGEEWSTVRAAADSLCFCVDMICGSVPVPHGLQKVPLWQAGPI